MNIGVGQRLGFSPAVGLVALEASEVQQLSEGKKAQIEQAVQDLLDQRYRIVKDLLLRNERTLRKVRTVPCVRMSSSADTA